MKKVLFAVSMISCVVAAPAMSAGDAAAGQAKSGTCAGCHGADGNSVAANFSKLAGQHENYLLKQLQDFKSGKRKDPTMTAMVAPLSEQDMANLAAYFSSQKVKPGKTAEDKLELGQTIYRAGNATSGVAACAACHSPTGAGNPQAKFPALKGQHAGYVVKQLKAFRSGARSNDAGSMMRGVASKLTDAEIEAVAQYVQGLQ
ncbi:c-type cytochrome [endosymbiont of unidentified scaly snail isolate Monju]|uniref:c-type cytochrome n=1 Tax=endosymbiont of unidentified scaly snail isolate Monju TaxID=1248727 RepID=UPI0005B7F37D|nr:c-type cytochrome [endosymbiont of unidentified scaly snail isolate Monju]